MMTDLASCLPEFAVTAIREALPAFERQIKGFAMPDAVMTGVETRTSSPIRIGRDATLQSLNTRGLYPAGEGAGYAGGILSAGVDGIRVAEAVAMAMVDGKSEARPPAQSLIMASAASRSLDLSFTNAARAALISRSRPLSDALRSAIVPDVPPRK